MTPAKHRRLLEGQATNARKVYHAVPIAETWTVKQIMSELSREGTALPVNILEGCLRSLHENGLIRGSFDRGFQRVALTPRAQGEPPAPALSVVRHADRDPHNNDVKNLVVEPRQEITAMDKLAQLASELRQISTTATALAARADDIAIEIEEAQQKVSADLVLVESLKKLLGNKS